MGSDFDAPDPAKQWNIATGIRSVDAGAIITYHGGRGRSAYDNVAGFTGFNLNNVYCQGDGVSYALSAEEYARPGPMPFFFIEGGYGNTEVDSAVRLQADQANLSGHQPDSTREDVLDGVCLAQTRAQVRRHPRHLRLEQRQFARLSGAGLRRQLCDGVDHWRETYRQAVDAGARSTPRAGSIRWMAALVAHLAQR